MGPVIGVYDSGFGGLTVLRACRAAMPRADWCYLGDSGRAPYGGRDAQAILDFAEQCVSRLLDEGCAVVVVACHTVSCVALRHLQARFSGPEVRILGVTIPAAEAAVAVSRGRIGFLGTARTVASGTFTVEVRKLGTHTVQEVAAPLLAPIVEEGWEDSSLAREAVSRYLAAFDEIDTLVLGCTHYPLLAGAFSAATTARILDPSAAIAERLVDWFARHPEFSADGEGRLRVMCTGEVAPFARHGARFLGAPLPEVERVIEGWEVPRGQVVRA